MRKIWRGRGKEGRERSHFAGFEYGDRWTSRKVMGYFWELENNFSVELPKGSTALPRCHQLSTLKPISVSDTKTGR